MRTMSREEALAFLSEGTRTGKVAVVRVDGSPIVTPVWFLVDADGSIVFTTAEQSVKGRSFARDGRISLCVDDQEPPFAFVRVDGRVSLSEDLEQLRRYATRLGARYMGEERAVEYGERNGVPGELLVRIEEPHIVGLADIAN
jgi:PPOX class probable F420-dependent enzyme